jgi:alanine-glyoxylate transaminase / serine-glyoxylate transaminase / serine-pyruvate transaminase
MTVSGRPFLQIPGPTNVPDRILRAMDRPVIDHRGPEFAALTRQILPLLCRVFGTRGGPDGGAPILFPGSGTGAWEAALVNVLAPGERVLAFNYGHFSAQFAQTARNLGYDVDEVPLRWGQAPTQHEVERCLHDGAAAGAAPGGNGSRGSARSAGGASSAGGTASAAHRPYRAVLVVQNETSTGVLADVGAVRRALDAAGSDALLIVDAVSALGSTPFLLDEWRVDVALAGSQKGLMLPPGVALLCAGPRARQVAQTCPTPRHYWDWRPILRDNATGFFPYTPATLLLFGLREALAMLVEEEGLDAVFARHERLAGGVRAALDAWRHAGLANLCEDPERRSPTLTTVTVPDTLDSDALIRHARERFGLSLGVGLGRIKGKVFRIGHLGALNELEVIGTLGGVELALRECGVQIELGSGVAAAQQSFVAMAPPVPADNGRTQSSNGAARAVPPVPQTQSR